MDVMSACQNVRLALHRRIGGKSVPSSHSSAPGPRRSFPPDHRGSGTAAPTPSLAALPTGGTPAMPGKRQRPDNPKHDASYKSFFTHPRTVADTLRAVAGDLARHLDFTTSGATQRVPLRAARRHLQRRTALDRRDRHSRPDRPGAGRAAWLPAPAPVHRMVTRRFGPSAAGQLLPVLDRISDPEDIAPIADAVIECETAEEFLDRVRGS